MLRRSEAPAAIYNNWAGLAREMKGSLDASCASLLATQARCRTVLTSTILVPANKENAFDYYSQQVDASESMALPQSPVSFPSTRRPAVS